MPQYRVYCLDSDGRIDFAQWIEASSDEEAIKKARDLKPHARRCEVWLQSQLISKLDSAGEFEQVQD